MLAGLVVADDGYNGIDLTDHPLAVDLGAQRFVRLVLLLTLSTLTRAPSATAGAPGTRTPASRRTGGSVGLLGGPEDKARSLLAAATGTPAWPDKLGPTPARPPAPPACGAVGPDIPFGPLAPNPANPSGAPPGPLPKAFNACLAASGAEPGPPLAPGLLASLLAESAWPLSGSRLDNGLPAPPPEEPPTPGGGGGGAKPSLLSTVSSIGSPKHTGGGGGGAQAI